MLVFLGFSLQNCISTPLTSHKHSLRYMCTSLSRSVQWSVWSPVWPPSSSDFSLRSRWITSSRTWWQWRPPARSFGRVRASPNCWRWRCCLETSWTQDHAMPNRSASASVTCARWFTTSALMSLTNAVNSTFCGIWRVSKEQLFSTSFSVS